MEPISKPELDKSALRIPTNIKRVLRSGELGTYDVLQLMGNTVNASAEEVNRATDWVNINGAKLFENEIERAKNEGNYNPSEGDPDYPWVNNGRIQAEEDRAANENERNEAEVLRKEAEDARKEAEEARAEAESLRQNAEDIREELRQHPWYIDDDGFLNEYSLEDHAYHRRDDRYMRGGIDYPTMRVLNTMHLYVLPVANGNQFRLNNGHLQFKMKTIAV